MNHFQLVNLHNSGRKIFSYLGLVVSLAGGLLFISYEQSSAKVSGACANCHTMHNSQDGSEVAKIGEGVGWSSEGILTGSTASAPQGSLLVSNCVGCHSSTSANTTISLGSNLIPIVYNTMEPDYNNTLAGGNFYWVADTGGNDDTKGHNVYGISTADSFLTNGAPGGETRCGISSACHNTLAASDNVYDRPGCQGCHSQVYHHTDNDHYRFLNNYHQGLEDYYVEGVEDEDWENTRGTGDHNYYKGVDRNNPPASLSLSNTHSISSYCAGCHPDFHDGSKIDSSSGMGGSSPWLRHPTDIILPNEREYAGYDPTTNYSTQAPVAWLNPDLEDSAPRSEAVVMCLSCHRPHGSPYPDMLRWDYDGMIAGDNETGAATGEGCFVCHTTKD